MTMEWYLHSLHKVFDLIGLPGRKFVGSPAQPKQAVRQHFLIKAVRRFDLFQSRMLRNTLLEPSIDVFGIFDRPFRLGFYLYHRRVSPSFELELSDPYSVSESSRCSLPEVDSLSL